MGHVVQQRNNFKKLREMLATGTTDITIAFLTKLLILCLQIMRFSLPDNMVFTGEFQPTKSWEVEGDNTRSFKLTDGIKLFDFVNNQFLGYMCSLTFDPFQFADGQYRAVDC